MHEFFSEKLNSNFILSRTNINTPLLRNLSAQCLSINEKQMKIIMTSAVYISATMLRSTIIALVFCSIVNSQDYGYAIQGKSNFQYYL